MFTFAKKCLTRLRGIVGLGVIAGAAAFVVGVGWTVIAHRLQFGFFPPVTNWFFLRDTLLPSAAEWCVRGALTGSGFGVALAALESKTSLHELPTWKVGLYGALSGVALAESILLVRALTTPILFLDAALATLPVAGVFGIFGAAVSTSMVAVAKKAGRTELSAGEDAVALLAAE